MARRFRLPAFPGIHFMAAAPLDVWLRLVLAPGARIGVRYWPRAGVNLVLSACVTAMTLPERLVLAPVLWWVGRRSRWRVGAGLVEPTARAVDHAPEDSDRSGDTAFSDRSRDRLHASGQPSLVVLGYYRTGTTHLHNLLACDPASRTPRWGEMLSPQGFVVSWFVLRLFLTAALPTRRPQDDMAFGPEWPGEDDFGLSNWTLASPLPGRVVVPNSFEHFGRFHDLEGLTARERARWLRTQWAILWKIGLLARGRRLLLKTPPHTARVAALTEVLGGPGRAKFIHLSREPVAVLRSNERLMRAMTPYHLQDGPGEEVVRQRLIAEYDATERRFLADEAAIPEGHVVRMRYEDLIADPVGELRRAYGALGMEWTAAFEARLGTYLRSVRAYRSETQKLAEGAGGPRERAGEAQAPEPLVWMVAAFGHDRPAIAAPPPADQGSAETSTGRAGAALSPVIAVALGSLGVWLAVVAATGHRSAIFAWLGGIAVGHTATARGPGSVGRGLACAAASLLVAVVGMVVATRLTDGAGFDPARFWGDLAQAAGRRLSHESAVLWIALGIVSAFRLGSRRFGAVPGR